MEKVEQYKQTTRQFIFNEFVIFLSQILVFFIVAVCASNLLTCEEKLVAFAERKIIGNSPSELGYIFLATVLVIGFFAILGRVFDNKYVEFYVNEILYELPRTIYFFGSATTGTMLAISLFLYLNPTEDISSQRFLALALIFSIAVFIYGCAFSFALKRKTHIKKDNLIDYKE